VSLKKKISYKEYENDLYRVYIQGDFLPMMTWENFLKWAITTDRFNNELGYDRKDIELK